MFLYASNTFLLKGIVADGLCISGDLMIPDVVEVDIVTDPRDIRGMHIAFVIHRVADGV
jgi:hypothetical protein